MLSIFYGFNAVLPCNCRFGMVLLPLLQLVYSPWPIRTIHRPTAWLCQCIFASTLYHLLRFCTLSSLFSLVVPTVASSFGNSWHNRSLKWIRASVWMISDVTNLEDKIDFLVGSYCLLPGCERIPFDMFTISHCCTSVDAQKRYTLFHFFRNVTIGLRAPISPCMRRWPRTIFLANAGG